MDDARDDAAMAEALGDALGLGLGGAPAAGGYDDIGAASPRALRRDAALAALAPPPLPAAPGELPFESSLERLLGLGAGEGLGLPGPPAEPLPLGLLPAAGEAAYHHPHPDHHPDPDSGYPYAPAAAEHEHEAAAGHEAAYGRLSRLQRRATLVQDRIQDADGQAAYAVRAIRDLQALVGGLKRSNSGALGLGPGALPAPPPALGKRAHAAWGEGGSATLGSPGLPAAREAALRRAQATGKNDVLLLAEGDVVVLPKLKKQRRRSPVYRNAELLRCLKTVCDESGQATVSSRMYQKRAKGRKLDQDRKWPTYETIVRRFGSWAEAFLQAGLIDAEGVRMMTSNKNRRHDDIPHAARRPGQAAGADDDLHAHPDTPTQRPPARRRPPM